MQTTIHTYQYRIDNADEREAYNALKARLKASGVHLMRSWTGKLKDSFEHAEWDGKTVTLDTKHLFSNQWNCEEYGRVFDWAEDYQPHNKRLRRGHYLDITPEMREIRENTNVCGYCGYKERAEAGAVFCHQCLDSEYLKSDDLHLLRMLPIAEHFPKRAPLTKTEKEHLLPLYKEAQLHGTTERGKVRIARKRAQIANDYHSRTKAARDAFEGFTWLMDNGLNTDNVIFYSHTGRFGFGWRKPLDGEVLSELLALITEFPFSYDIKCADGRTLSGE